MQLRVSPPAFIGILIFKIAAREKKILFFLQLIRVNALISIN